MFLYVIRCVYSGKFEVTNFLSNFFGAHWLYYNCQFNSNFNQATGQLYTFLLLLYLFMFFQIYLLIYVIIIQSSIQNMHLPIQDKENYQQFCFQHSKLVFFFGEDNEARQQTKKKDKKAKQLRKSSNSPVLNNWEYRQKVQLLGSSSNTKCYTSQMKKRVKFQKFGLSIPIAAPKSNRSQKLQKNKTKIQGSSQRQGKKQQGSQFNGDTNSHYHGLSHHQIKTFCGPHHALYRHKIDYLTKPALLPALRDIQRLATPNHQQYNLRASYMPNLQVNSYEAQNKTSKSWASYRKAYTLDNQRAAIAEGVMNKSHYQVYEKMIKKNMRDVKYVDKQFCHQNYPKIGGQKSKWTYIAPSPSLFLFPIGNTIQKRPIFNSISKVLPFVNFMRFLYTFQPQYFTRLLEPPVNNVFSVWLFSDRLFRPVIIDGYFPVDQDGKYLFGDQQNLWVTIFSKCICKVFNTFNMEKLKEISDFQIYNLLTGRNLLRIPLNYFESSEEKIISFVERQSNKNRSIVCKNSENLTIVTEQQCRKLIKEVKQKGSDFLKALSFYLISKPQPTFTASFAVFIQMITKFQLFCSNACQLNFLVPNQKKVGYSKIYIYKNNEDQSQTNRLELFCELNPSEDKSIKLKTGNYKIFYQDGIKLMKTLFSNSKGRQTHNVKGSYDVTIMGNCPFKLSSGELLEKYNGRIQDSKSFYRSS